MKWMEANMTGKRILVIDDDPHIVELLRLYFEKEGYEFSSCADGLRGLQLFQHIQPDVVLLDLMLPSMDGYDVCRAIRRESTCPILMLTARGETLDKVVGLELGADDYIQKPFDPKELLARVKAVLRRVKLSEQEALEEDPPQEVRYRELLIDRQSYTCVIRGKVVDLPPRELELFYYMAAHPNRVFTREQLLSAVWGYDHGDGRTVDVHIKRIRERLETHHGTGLGWEIKTVWGVGYKFECI